MTLQTTPRLGIILGSTRPGRNGEAVANWVFKLASQRADAEFELVDLIDYDLPLLDEAIPASFAPGQHSHTKQWAYKIASFDGYVFVTPEYNHSTSAALKNAIDYLYREWTQKAAGFVGYGGYGGARAIEQLRLVMGALHVADVGPQVSLSLFTDFENFKEFRPAGPRADELHAMLDQLVAWSAALAPLRTAA
jgi:NAD(P)H-dependent FMN reductase